MGICTEAVVEFHDPKTVRLYPYDFSRKWFLFLFHDTGIGISEQFSSPFLLKSQIAADTADGSRNDSNSFRGKSR